MIDFILLNSAALGELVIDSGFVLGSSHPDYDWRNDPIPAGYASDHCAIAVDMVPAEGMGHTVTAAPWPNKFTSSALKNSPKAEALKISTSTPSAGTTGDTVPIDGAKYIANKRSHKLHYATCGNAKKTSDKNKVGYNTYEEAMKAGCEPAGCCKPTAD
jgi:hypothetical protein